MVGIVGLGTTCHVSGVQIGKALTVFDSAQLVFTLKLNVQRSTWAHHKIYRQMCEILVE